MVTTEIQSWRRGFHSYELAYRMQTTAAEAVDLEKESRQTREMYGLDQRLTEDFGRKCLITRRLLERGVRFVQLYSGGGHIEDTWDGHVDCISNHTLHAGETDQPIGALITDLKRTGLWDETLVVWGGEFGRTPTSEGLEKARGAITTGTDSACGWPAPA